MKGIVALIPARSGSKGLPDKNIKLLGSKPILTWSIETCLQSKRIDRVIVSTDSKEYADIALLAGAEVPFLRPSEISQDHSTDKDFIVHALDYLKDQDQFPEYVVHIRPTTPIRDPNLVDEAILSFTNSSDATSMRSVHEMPESAYKTFEISPKNFLMPLAAGKNNDESNRARQSFPVTYSANGYVDVLSTKFINNFDLIHGDRIMPFMTPYTLEIDTYEDFNIIETVISRKENYNNNKK